jgi:hypothetical protein
MVLAKTSISLSNVELVNFQLTAQPAPGPSLYIVLNSLAQPLAGYRGGNEPFRIKSECVSMENRIWRKTVRIAVLGNSPLRRQRKRGGHWDDSE